MTGISLFDSHAHLDTIKGGETELAALLDRVWAAGLKGIVAIAGATKAGEYTDTLSISERDSRIYVAAGIHPHAASSATLNGLDLLRRALDHLGVVALGEIGLDYHYNHSAPADQRRAFVDQIKMAHKTNLPIVIHTREADDDTLSILRDEGASDVGGVVHCFSGGPDFARAVLDLGFYVSFSGIVTFPKATEVQEAAVLIPEDKILAETDSPFLSPVPFRGKVNEPHRVLHVVEKLAELRNTAPEKMGAFTVENTRRCFKMDSTS